MKLRLLKILWILSISSCATIKDIKPYKIIYEVRNNKACYYKDIGDIKDGKMVCKEFSELDGIWYVVNGQNLKEMLTRGVDEMIDNSQRQRQVESQVKPITTNFNGGTQPAKPK